MSSFLINNDIINVVNDNVSIVNNIPTGTFIVKFNDKSNCFYLEKTNNFIVNNKIYDDADIKAKRIFIMFKDHRNNIGVLLNGEKGSGKTLLLKLISLLGLKENVPTLITNTCFYGDSFNTFISSIIQPVIIFFDEFEKIYKGEEDANKLLTLLDGTISGKKLFLFSVNDVFHVGPFFKNRPGRIFKYRGLNEEIIKGYCTDNLKYTEYTDKICTISKMFSNFNFDMLKALIEEINRYGELPAQVIKMLNLKTEYCEDKLYTVSIYEKGVLISTIDKWLGNPFEEVNRRIDYTRNDNNEEWEIDINPSRIKSIDKTKSTIIMQDDEDIEVRFTEINFVSRRLNIEAF